MFARMRELVADQTFDVVQIEHSMMMAYREAVPANFGGKTVLDLHNVGERQYQRMRQMGRGARERVLFWLKARAMQNWEAAHAARFDRVLTVSDEDAAWLRARNPTLQVEVVENGVDTDERPYLKETEGSCRVLFVGTLGYPPNEDAVMWFCAEILPLIRQTLPQAEFVIVGRAPRERVQALARQSGVQVLINVSDVGPLYESAQVVVVPLRAGGGTRLKILEAMAYGRAVVSTAIGSEGLDVADGETIVLADTPQEFAAAVIHLLCDDAARTQLACNARRLVEQRYTWKQIGAKLLRIYNELAL
jgi:glycosyltransferase involved in cell wall biosynthesis